MFGAIGFAFGVMFGSSRFALRNAVRASAMGLVGYFVYQLIAGYADAKARAADDLATDHAFGRATRGGRAVQGLAESPLSMPTMGNGSLMDGRVANTTSGRSSIHGSDSDGGRRMRFDDADVTAPKARVGRGVIRR